MDLFLHVYFAVTGGVLGIVFVYGCRALYCMWRGQGMYHANRLFSRWWLAGGSMSFMGLMFEGLS